VTVENNVFTIKSRRKEHPNAPKYVGRPTMEFGTAFRKFLGDIGPNVDLFLAGKHIFEEEVTAEFFDSIKKNDIIGIGLAKGFNEIGENRHNEPAAYKFKVLKVNKKKDTLSVRNVTFEHPKSKHVGTECELAFEDISCALGMGFAEILERKGKPYGVSEEVELKIKIVDYTKETSEGSTSPNNPSSTQTTSDESKSLTEAPGAVTEPITTGTTI
jgi:hypothetical protein